MHDVHSTEYSFKPKDALLGAQMLFVAFGALVLVPLLTGLDANVALFTAGAGTLLFQAVTRGKVPVFLASSFAFIAPIIYGVQTWGIPATMCGLFGAGVLYVVISLLVRIFGVGMLRRILPPVVTGPVIMVIGLILAPVAVHMAMGRTGDGSAWLVPSATAMIIAGVALLTTILASLLGRGWIKLIPILLGITAGYATSLVLDATGFAAATQAAFDPGQLPNWTAPTLVDFSKIGAAPLLAVPNFVFPTWNLEAILFIVPVAIAPAIEHFGDVLAIGNISGKDYVKDPGVQNTLLGDGLATSLAAALGGPPNTTYSEVSGAVALTRAFNPGIMTWAAITAIVLAFVGKLGAFLGTIPTPVMGGIMILLFGAITVIGINTLVRAGNDLMLPRNLAVVGIILVVGIGGMTFDMVSVKLGGIGLAGIVGVVLNLVLPCKNCNDPLPDEVSPSAPDHHTDL
ncbi:MAG: uracil-xanthine permease family protein [Pseudodesulfovibrio sp.]|uniref:Uracil-xanthine permease n=1 Tax=Pseudodesulfovibrio aespoeensis (strain ATCC 700646 / DSM 10631 / Aspo-2) TaxID=643562 RepID=E6VTQ8_PSEA9|nr:MULTISPECIES: uracil-xanthine permease family protein [Pseudodesulfovibrio]MBU4245237.1 uracil-xanthine permease family protein [Pseudomonadota bacterium]ADU63345.1 uracil-xanthine permease [Pseudodesulfovibrio aespoeensis Aspo-2]MBU4380016.1 uracil-xanthine permease family protein [Pseudomonadota bacterium]MBU4476018.1 uracil-xanthine permease family protein [Pseudomonadota bacterium]MBU4517566.1 uracil-xanthine permease family protein [Pseudomonadota bacterium]